MEHHKYLDHDTEISSKLLDENVGFMNEVKVRFYKGKTKFYESKCLHYFREINKRFFRTIRGNSEVIYLELTSDRILNSDFLIIEYYTHKDETLNKMNGHSTTIITTDDGHYTTSVLGEFYSR